MSEAEETPSEPSQEVKQAKGAENSAGASRRPSWREALRWWLKASVQPVLFLLAGALLLVGLAISQRFGWISSGGGADHARISADGKSATRYICPMMCTPPLSEPGRCPVCGMELVPMSSSSGTHGARSIVIDPATRRIANIHTVAVKSTRLARHVRAIGSLSFDEGTLKSLSAYVDGRLDRLFADYTGVVVKKGDKLALLYSPELYSGQVEFLLAKKSRDQSQNVTLDRVLQSRQDLYASAKQRLIELGMTDDQIADLEQAGKPNSRLPLCAPISGTVIEKRAVEGQYVKEGQPIFQLADLSNVWLMLELFPEDAVSIHYGQKVEANVQSLPGRVFKGRVAFIDPVVDPKKRSVGVRVVVPNTEGVLRVGDFAKATIDVPVSSHAGESDVIYDAELANKWISPRHPHVIESAPGKCRVCGVDLVPASEFGFVNTPSKSSEVLVVPRSAVLMAGGSSVVYVETENGRFEIRRVTLGPYSGDLIVILSGVREGEQVAVSGNFLIDSQMQLAGNPSLVDPTRIGESEAKEVVVEEVAKRVAALSALSPDDRLLAEQQKVCPVSEMPLGSMGVPIKVDVHGRPVFICCDGCRESLLAEPEKYLAKLSREETQ